MLEAGLEASPPDSKTLGGILPRLKKAIQDGETKTAGAILKELGLAKLSPSGRELYILLYDLLLENRAEKALDAIYFWERLHTNDD